MHANPFDLAGLLDRIIQLLQFYVLSNRAGRTFLNSRSRVPGVLGTRARGNANFLKESRNVEREDMGTLISRS